MQSYVTRFVRKLTLSAYAQRLFVVTKPARIHVTLALLAINVVALADAQPLGAWHPIADIAAVAERFVSARMRKGATAGSTTIKAGMLDNRIRLAACDKPLEPFLRPGTKIEPKTIVGVRCSGNKAWKMYVPVEVAVRDSVWVARHPLPRGHLLTQADLIADERDISRMNSGYVSSAKALIGQRLRQAVLAGRAFTPRIIEADHVVRRGQTVTLAVSSGGINIRMTGKALMDGALNQRIRVENLNSGRIVEGIVRSRQHVEVLIPTTGKLLHAKPKVSPTLADTGN